MDWARCSRPRFVADEHWPAELAFLAGVVFAIVVGVLFAIPALRTRGVNLAVVTLGLGFAVQQVIFANPYFTGGFGSVTEVGRIEVFGWDVSSAEHPERYFVVCLAVFVVSALMVANLRRSGSGRRLIAVRNNERAAASLGISVFGAKVYAFAVGAAIASFAGILLAFKDTTVVYSRYQPFQSITTVGNAVAGGIGWVFGAVFGAQFAEGGIGTIFLDWFDLGTWLITIGGIVLIVIVVFNPNGIASVVLNDERGIGKLRIRLRRAPRREELGEGETRAVSPATLEVQELTVRFGGVVAIDNVSFGVEPGQIVGLIGPNGAGKTTIVDAVTGFTKPTEGRVTLDGTAMVGRSWSPARRAPGRDPALVPVARAVRGHLGRGEPPCRRRGAHAPLGTPRPVLAGTPPAPAGRCEQRQGVRPRARPRPAARRAPLRPAPPRRHRPRGRVRTIGVAARRARGGLGRDRDERARGPRSPARATSGAWPCS